MQISSRFTVAVHVLICIEMFKNDHKVTSDFLASSVNANPVVIRRLLQQLKAAGPIRKPGNHQKPHQQPRHREGGLSLPPQSLKLLK